MTPEALLCEVENGSEDSVVQLLAGTTEKQRKAASAVVIERLERAIRPYLNQGLSPSQARQLVYQMAGINRALDFRPQLALLGAATLGEIKRYGAGFPAKAYEVLAARKPKWLPEWCDWAVHASWPVVRRLVREGLCERPASDEYYLHMLNGGGYVGGARQLLEADPGLLEHEVWELFRRQGTREASLANDFVGWSDALVALSAEGRISRDRLLDASLEALELPFKPHNTTWYRNFHEALKPSVPERAARLSLYLALASSPVPATVKFAWKAIEAVEKAGSLPLDAILDCAGSALMSKEKGTAAAVLRLLQRAFASNPACRERVVLTAAAALEHPAADIQASAFELIQELGQITPDLKTLVASKLDLASSPVRERARGWLGSGAATAEVERYVSAMTRPDPLAPDRAIRPIEDVEDLVLTMTRLLNRSGPADDVERALDGLSRLCAERPPRFDDLTSPLRNHVAASLESGLVPQFGGVFSVQTCMVQLAAAWLNERLTIRPGDSTLLLQAALAVRPYWVALRAKNRRPRPLLSAPTHSGGWIDPAILARRIAAGLGGADDREWAADLTQARLRLPGETAPSHTYELSWHSDKFDRDLLRAAMKVEPEPVRDITRLEDVLAAETQPLPGSFRVLSWGDDDPLRRSSAAGSDLIAWSAQIWPANREGWCALGAFRIANNLDWSAANWDNRAFLADLHDPCRQLGPAAYLLLALGLMTREATEFDTARDGLIRIIGDGRLDCTQLGSALAKLFQDGVVRGARLARAVTDAARISPRHADAMRQVAEHALSQGLPPRPADQSALLEAFLEACTASGTGPASGGLRRLLESVSGSGKGPKLARSLLALTPGLG